MNRSEFTTVIYIDNVRRNATHLGSVFFVDSDSHPFQRCAQHSLTLEALAALKRGTRVRTSGCVYSLTENSEPFIGASRK